MTKILLVEDDKSLREIYGVRLLEEGYDIVTAGDGEEALAMAIKERPQLIVSDVMMPKISGFDMLDILRSTTETRDTKVIMMTALSSEEQRARGVSLGADRYLVKSQVGIEDVVRTVHEVLGDMDGNQQPTSQPNFPASNQPAQPEQAAPQPETAQPQQQVAPAPVQSSVPAPGTPVSNTPGYYQQRVIQPLPNSNTADLGKELEERIAKELEAVSEPQPSQPAPQPEPQQFQQPQPAQPAQPQAPEPQTNPPQMVQQPPQQQPQEQQQNYAPPAPQPQQPQPMTMNPASNPAPEQQQSFPQPPPPPPVA